MLASALKIGRLPAQGVSEALKRSANPSAIEALSTAIAKASLSGIEDEKIEVSGLTVNIDFNEEKLLATGGLATAISLGSVYWLGSKLDVQYRYAQLTTALRNLSQGIALGNEPLVQESFKKIDDLSNPLLNPRTLEPIDDVDTVKDLYQYLFNKPAQSGSMFNAKVLKESVEEGLKLGTQLSIRTAKEAVDETLEAVVKKASSKAGS